jgi:predicted RNase H-like nuclease
MTRNEGAQRLLKSGVTIPVLHLGDPKRIVVEAYPALLARHLGHVGYKNDATRKQTEGQLQARRSMMDDILSGKLWTRYGLLVEAPRSSADDPSGDQLDALICAIQAAWAWTNAPQDVDGLEGWIADPTLSPMSFDLTNE